MLPHCDRKARTSPLGQIENTADQSNEGQSMPHDGFGSGYLLRLPSKSQIKANRAFQYQSILRPCNAIGFRHASQDRWLLSTRVHVLKGGMVPDSDLRSGVRGIIRETRKQ